MTDRKLLELAAKAAGYDIDWSDWLDCGSHTKYKNRTTGQWWNAEHDDGDAFRLAVKLHLPVEAVIAFVAQRETDWETDPYAATRRAIVRAAAEIGKVMT
jgi:hypothetical protein